jgi:putative DNA primase/helicase
VNFEQAMRGSGLRPRDIVADGRWHRCPTDDRPRKRNGAFVLHPDGRGYWRNWATDEGVNSWRDEQATARPIDEARLRAARDRDRAYRVAAMRGARVFWNNARPLNRIHPYIERKGLSALGCAGLRQRDELLVVPVLHSGGIISVQTISPDGAKRFWPGAPVKGGAYVLHRQRGALTCVCEGLATGLALYQCVRHASVIVAFDAGNLLAAVDRVRPSGAVVICADNDHKTAVRTGINPGVEKARNAAELIECGVAYPTGIEGTDWADCIKEWGEGAHRRIERLILSQAKYVPEPVP